MCNGSFLNLPLQNEGKYISSLETIEMKYYILFPRYYILSKYTFSLITHPLLAEYFENNNGILVVS